MPYSTTRTMPLKSNYSNNNNNNNHSNALPPLIHKSPRQQQQQSQAQPQPQTCLHKKSTHNCGMPMHLPPPPKLFTNYYNENVNKSQNVPKQHTATDQQYMQQKIADLFDYNPKWLTSNANFSGSPTNTNTAAVAAAAAASNSTTKNAPTTQLNYPNLLPNNSNNNPNRNTPLSSQHLPSISTSCTAFNNNTNQAYFNNPYAKAHYASNFCPSTLSSCTNPYYSLSDISRYNYPSNQRQTAQFSLPQIPIQQFQDIDLMQFNSQPFQPQYYSGLNRKYF